MNYFDGFDVIPAGTEILCPVCRSLQAVVLVPVNLKEGHTIDVRAIRVIDQDGPFGISCCEERWIDFDGRIFTEYGWS